MDSEAWDYAVHMLAVKIYEAECIVYGEVVDFAGEDDADQDAYIRTAQLVLADEGLRGALQRLG